MATAEDRQLVADYLAERQALAAGGSVTAAREAAEAERDLADIDAELLAARTPRGPDRRKGHQRAVDQRLHLTRELLLLKAQAVAVAYAGAAVHDPELRHQLDELQHLCSAVTDAEAAAR